MKLSNLRDSKDWCRVFCYPKCDDARFKELINYLRDYGVNEIISYGKVRIGNINVIGKGHSSVIVLGRHDNYGLVAIKIRRVDSKVESLILECKLMNLGYPVTPKAYLCSDDLIIREFIVGMELSNLINHLSNCSEATLLVLSILASAFWLDLVGIDHKELSRPDRHIIVTDKLTARIIDLESASLRRGCNVCRVLSWLLIRRKLLSRFCFNAEDIKSKINSLLRQYKRGSLKCFIDICRVISEYMVKFGNLN